MNAEFHQEENFKLKEQIEKVFKRNKFLKSILKKSHIEKNKLNRDCDNLQNENKRNDTFIKELKNKIVELETKLSQLKQSDFVKEATQELRKELSFMNSQSINSRNEIVRVKKQLNEITDSYFVMNENYERLLFDYENLKLHNESIGANI